MPTDNQLLHRQYLQSEVWRAKRGAALAHYGPTCRRCGGYGNDVHHRTYERSGGAELMGDLEILCRDCHEAHHRVERISRPRRKNGGMNKQAIARYLTSAQREILQQRFNLTWGQIYTEIMAENKKLTNDALKMLGKKYAYTGRGGNGRATWRGGPKHYARLMS